MTNDPIREASLIRLEEQVKELVQRFPALATYERTLVLLVKGAYLEGRVDVHTGRLEEQTQGLLDRVSK